MRRRARCSPGIGMLLRDDTLLSPQFQALLKAFKSETLSFEALLAGAERGTPAGRRPALMW